MNIVNIALAFACLSALCLILAAQIEKHQQRIADLRAQAWDGQANDGENFI